MRSEWSPSQRKSRIAAIHVCKQQLRMDDDAYRELLARVSRQHGLERRSAAELTQTQAGAVLAEMRRLGAERPTEPRPGGRSRPAHYPGTPHSDREMPAEISKIEAQLADMGLPWAYADAMAKRMHGIERVAWCSKPNQLIAILAALHVEQEKRQLLDGIRYACKEAGTSVVGLAMRLKLSKGWERRRSTLRAVRDYLISESLARELGL